MGAVALVLVLAGCSMEGTSPSELGRGTVDDVSQAHTAYPAVECAKRDSRYIAVTASDTGHSAAIRFI